MCGDGRQAAARAHENIPAFPHCKAQRGRLVHNVSPGGEQRVLMSSLFDEKLFPAECFDELYHKRWGIEAAFKRLKRRLNPEHVTGLSQPAVAQGLLLCRRATDETSP